jgi:nucleoside-diphosphate-sugar epimerase
VQWRVLSRFDDEQATAALRGVDAIVHLAARVHLQDTMSQRDLTAYRAANVGVTESLLDASEHAGVGRVIVASSVKACGESSSVALTESDAPRPTDAYGISKLEVEQSLEAFARRTGVLGVALRLPVVYGSGMRANMLRLFDLVRRSVPLPLASVRNRRSLLYAGNFTRAVTDVLGEPTMPSGSYFVSDQADLSTPELLREVATALETRSALFAMPHRALRALALVGDHVPGRAGTLWNSEAMGRLTGSLFVSSAKLTAAAGYRPEFTVRDALRETARWYVQSHRERH